MKKNKVEPVFEEDEYQSVAKIRGRIIDNEKGMRFLPEVLAVRIRSERFGLLIMEDYMPTLGSIDGSVVFLTPEGEVRYDAIQGFYKHQYNEFTLLVQSSKDTAQADAPETQTAQEASE